MALNNRRPPETNRRILGASREAAEAIRRRQEENPQGTQREQVRIQFNTLAHLAEIRANQARTIREFEGARYKGAGSSLYALGRKVGYR